MNDRRLINVIDQLQHFPAGKDFVDILIIAMLLGWALGSLMKREGAFTPSMLSGFSILLIVYTFFTLWHGGPFRGLALQQGSACAPLR